MRVKAKRQKDGYLIPYIKEFGDLEEVEIEIKIPQIIIDSEGRKLSDDFIEKNWRELILTSTDTSEFYKTAEYYFERARDYMERQNQ